MEAAEDDAFPVGLVFSPTDEQIVSHYLARKITGSLLPRCLIREADVYSTEPWNLLGARSSEAYFFATRKRKSPAGSRVDRRAGSGSWTLYGKEELVTSFVGGVETLVGRKNSLSFNDGRRKNSGWTMHEYEMFSASGEFQAQVVCHIKRVSRGNGGAASGCGQLKRKRESFLPVDVAAEPSPWCCSKRARPDQEILLALFGASAKKTLTTNATVASPEDITWGTPPSPKVAVASPEDITSALRSVPNTAAAPLPEEIMITSASQLSPTTDELFASLMPPEDEWVFTVEEIEAFLLQDDAN
ncbi:NAC transcription factor [Canna indica]|uniref:NAC transcription factor n=1 Tax=Canna indica TaxID=4628 RepID=A0AAQ3L3W3_9LILI|nr:NAC transcription factor [Canna indica]